MPLGIIANAGAQTYGNPFVGPVNRTLHVKLDVSGMTTSEIDANGYLKPGVPLTLLGVLVGAGVAVGGVTVEAVKLPIVTPVTTASLAAEVGDPLIAVATHVAVNRDIVEDNLGRVLSAAEVAGFAAAGSTCVLTTT